MGKQPPADVIAAAQAGAAKWGVPASVTLAQWALESGWGQHMPPGSNNPFGIKARPGVDPAVNAQTGKAQQLAQPFRKFASLAEAFDWHAQLLATRQIYQPAMAVRSEPNAFAKALTGRYATQPGYGDMLIAVMKGSNLYQYDAPAAPAAKA
jgi:flagellum-specific peptidoglycan hydrolase FlgJ